MDIYFNKKFNKILSLGSNCYPKLFIEKIIKPPYGQTELFDYIGTSMWSIHQLLKNDFVDMINNSYLQLQQTIEGEKPIVINTKYYLRFKHDLKEVPRTKDSEFHKKIKRRILRFKENSIQFDKILFIRHQETQTKRIPFGIQQTQQTCSELEELRHVLDILQVRYNSKNVKVIYINLDTDGWNEKHDIFSVKIDSLDYDWKEAHTVIKTLFEEKKVMEQLDIELNI